MLYYVRRVSLKTLCEVETLGLRRLKRETFGRLVVSLTPLSFISLYTKRRSNLKESSFSSRVTLMLNIGILFCIFKST